MESAWCEILWNKFQNNSTMNKNNREARVHLGRTQSPYMMFLNFLG